MKFPVDKLPKESRKGKLSEDSRRAEVATVNIDEGDNQVEVGTVKLRNKTTKDHDPIPENKTSW